jgi:hypothetical protein
MVQIHQAMLNVTVLHHFVIDLSDVDWGDGEEWVEIPLILPKS